MTTSLRTLVPVAAAVLAAAALGTACSSGGAHTTAAVPAPVATRWWNDGSVAVGSTIDPAHPAAAAAGLHADRSTYCAILSSTLKAGHSVFGSQDASSPAIATTTQAWLAELVAVAPADVAGDWHIMSKAVLALVDRAADSAQTSGSDGGGSTTAIQAAGAAISADAKASCGLNLLSS